MNKLSDATYVGTIEAITGHNLRDQTTPQELQRLAQEVALAKMRGSRN